MIVIEGCDNTGKTTLFHKLRIDLNMLGVLNVRPTDRWDMYNKTLNLLDIKHPIIIDRWAPISESIYGPICRNDQMLSEADLFYSDHRLAHDKSIVIFCNPELSQVESTIHERDQMEGVVKFLRPIYYAYQDRIRAAQERGVRVIEYNYLSSSYEDLLNQLKEHHAN